MNKWPILLGFLLSSCGTMLPGQIYTADGKVMPFQIEQARRSGKVAATDPDTQEAFAGSYVATLARSSAISATLVGDTPRVSTSTGGTNMATATAFLKGDKGTMLNCVMQIEAGLSPHGIGSCEDNRSKKYRLQF